MLVEKIESALRDVALEVSNLYLFHLRNAAASVESSSAGDKQIASYVKRLDKILSRRYVGSHTLWIGEFAQLLGEASFYSWCVSKGISMRAIPENKNRKNKALGENLKAPDFEASFGQASMHFEVKTFSIVDGQYGVADDLEQSLVSHVNANEKLKAGARSVWATSEAKPYGDLQDAKPSVALPGFDHSSGIDLPLQAYSRRVPPRIRTPVIKTNIEKIQGNIKQGQFSRPNTFLVVNMLLLRPTEHNVTKQLRPSFLSPLPYRTAITGEMWAMAFGGMGMPIQTLPDPLRDPWVEGRLDSVGVLADPEYADVAGILFMIHPFQKPWEVGGLFRASDLSRWEAEAPNLLEAMMVATDGKWNDCGDSNGGKLR